MYTSRHNPDLRSRALSRITRRQLISGVAIAGLSSAAVPLLWTNRSSQAAHYTWEAYLQGGSCNSLDAEPRIPLGELLFGTKVGLSASPVASPGPEFPLEGPDPILPALTSTAAISMSLADLLATPHAIVVEGVEVSTGARTLLTCGNVGGVVNDGELLFGLQAVAGDIAGVAWLSDNAAGATTVILFVTQGLATGGFGALHTTDGTPAPSDEGEGSPLPAETPVGGAPTQVTVESHDIFFEPKEFTIAANTDVTVQLPNQGALPHNFSVTDHNQNPDVPDLGISVDIQPGEEQSATINAPAGDYYFFCNVPGHEAAGMFGTMHVVEN